MKLEASVDIRRTPDEVREYLSNLSKLPQWDHGVAATRATSAVAPGVGFEFDTLAYPRKAGSSQERGKMSYRISDADPVRGCTVQLSSRDGNARFFKNAEWRFSILSTGEATRLFCTALFKLRFRYLWMAPIFYGMRGAIQSDLEKLRRVLEHDASTSKLN